MLIATPNHFSAIIPTENNTIASDLNITLVDSNVTGTITWVSCEEVALERISSLIFTFVATLFLCYVITALLVFAHKKKLIFGCCTGSNDSYIILDWFIIFRLKCNIKSCHNINRVSFL